MSESKSGFFDLQLNGCYGVDFNSDDLTGEGLAAACHLLRLNGVDRFLLTIITDEVELMCRRIRQVVLFRCQSALVTRMIAGIHVEGPFISPQPGYVGTHRPEHVKEASLEVSQKIFEAGNGIIRLFTLAPECDKEAFITKWLVKQNVCVSAGHCNPSIDQLQEAIDNGLSIFTHLGNGCPRTLERHDNIINRVLSFADHLWITFIADGVHVPFFTLRNYLNLVGMRRAIVVSDGISASGLGPGRYELAGQEIVVDNLHATWSTDKSHLMGSAMTMAEAYQKLRKEVGLSEADAHSLTCDNPRIALGL